MNPPCCTLLLAGLITVCAVHAAAPATPPPVPPGSGEKSHTLFMGADVSVELDKVFHRVRDVSRSSWVVNVKGRPEFIPTQQRALNLRVERSLKLTEKNATVANFKGERTYSPGNDPRQRALVNQVQMSAFVTEQSMSAERDFLRAQNDKVWADMGDGRNPVITPPPDPEGAMQRMTAAQDFALSQMTDPRFHQTIGEEQMKLNAFDAIEVEFEVSSAKPLPNPYIVVVAQFREPDAAPNMARHWIHAQSIDPIDATPQKIRVSRGGFPNGYTLDKVDVHIFDQGKEVATNLSPKRVPLTAEEAFQYLVIEHIGGNKGKTVPAVPAMAKLPAELRSRLAEGQGQQVYYVKVSKDGAVSEAYEDEDYTRKIADPFFASAVKGILFKPALEGGKPVEGKAKVDVAKLQL